MDTTPLRVMSLHALVYCERLFYLEEVEELRVADAAVWAGRRLPREVEEPAEVSELTLESGVLGLQGRVDAVRTRDGQTYPIEHKRGRSRMGEDDKPAAWDSDRVQAIAYALLLEEHLGVEILEARVRYHADNCTVRVPVTPEGRAEVIAAIARARGLSATTQRPPVTADERKCVRCSLAPVCLPEETRLAEAIVREDTAVEAPKTVRLFPPDTERRSLHVVTQGARVGKSGERLTVTDREGAVTKHGLREISDIVLHGFAQITTQALRTCADEEIPVHLVTTTGAYLGGFFGAGVGVQRRIRQYRGLCDEALVLALCRRLIAAKVDNQLQHVLRASRKDEALRVQVEPALLAMRQALAGLEQAADRETIMGHEGAAARGYFAALTAMVDVSAGEEMKPDGRSKRPPSDRFNALLSFGYGLLYRDLVSAILRVGLEPSFGLLHQPRSAALPLALDLMELFRVAIVDMGVMGAVNRRTFDPVSDFVVTGPQVWLSDPGRRKLIEVYERRKHEEYKHEAIGYSLSYARMMELETRLLEKEWSGEPGLFARFRLR
jgi:CRISPR-associated protein Cas1